MPLHYLSIPRHSQQMLVEGMIYSPMATAPFDRGALDAGGGDVGFDLYVFPGVLVLYGGPGGGRVYFRAALEKIE